MKKKYNLGGDLLQTGVSFIPGVGQILSPLVGMFSQQMDQQMLEQQKPKPQMNMNMNPFGKLALGGIINDGFKQYQTGSHASGNDLPIDANGNPDPNGVNTVQNKENSYKVGDKQYVMSDTLTNPKTGNKIATDAKMINKKYPEARFLLDQRNALDLEMKFLAKENDIQRGKVESKQMSKGGYPEDPEVPPSENLMFNAQNIYPIQLPTMYPQPVARMVPQDNSTTDGTLATDSTTFGTEIAPIGNNLANVDNITERSTNPTIAKSTNTPDILSAQTANSIGLGMKGLALAGSVVDALQPAEKEKLILPNYTKADNYIQSANVDFTQAKQDAQGVSNIAAGTNRGLSSNAASYQGREMSRLASLSDQLSRISEAQNSAQSQLNMSKGQYEQNKAVDTANRQYQNQQGNMQNQANGRFFDRTLMSDLSQIGSSFNSFAETQKTISNNKQLNEFQINQQIQLLNSKHPNVKITPDIIEKLKNGATIDDILKISMFNVENKEKI